MPHLANQIAAILSQVQHPGEFYASGTLDMHPFQLQLQLQVETEPKSC